MHRFICVYVFALHSLFFNTACTLQPQHLTKKWWDGPGRIKA